MLEKPMFFGKKPSPTAAIDPTPPAPAANFMAQPAAAPAATIEQKPILPPEEARKRAAMAKHIAASFGEIITLLMRSPADKAITLQDLEWMVVPAILTGQFAVAEAQSKETGVVMPVGAVLWAFVSAEIDQKLMSNPDQPVKLAPADWRSGDNPWVVMAIGDPKIVGGLLQQLMKTAFAGRTAKMRARGADGKVTVGRLEAGPPPSA
jgi:hemolysin-activating ACP:hemolysin acyltransferase